MLLLMCELPPPPRLDARHDALHASVAAQLLRQGQHVYPGYNMCNLRVACGAERDNTRKRVVFGGMHEVSGTGKTDVNTMQHVAGALHYAIRGRYQGMPMRGRWEGADRTKKR